VGAPPSVFGGGGAIQLNSCCFILDLLHLCVGYFCYLVAIRKLTTQEAVRPCASVELNPYDVYMLIYIYIYQLIYLWVY